MEVRKVTIYRTPSLPDKNAILRNPALLKSLPERWKHNGMVCAALASVSAMLMTSCSIKTGSKGGEAAVPVPFFEHGGGMGGFGCVSIAPPAFLSEAEALEVINEVSSRDGLVFTNDGTELKNVPIPETSTGPSPDYKPIRGSKNGTLVLDGTVASKNVSFEFISREDIDNWCVAESMATVTSYDFIDTAKVLNDSLNKINTGMAVAVFYDPCYEYDDSIQKIIDDSGLDYQKSEPKIKELVKEDLRQQVQDFIAWLKAQGII